MTSQNTDPHASTPSASSRLRGGRRLGGAVPAVVLMTGIALASGAGGAVAGSLITGKDIKDSSVTGKDIKDGSLKVGDLASDVGPAIGFTNYRTVFVQQDFAAGATGAGPIASCPDGLALIGGGAWWTTSNAPVQAVLNAEFNLVRGYADGSQGVDTMNVRVICARIPG